MTESRIGAGLLAPVLLLSACTTVVPVEVTPPEGHREDQVDQDSKECEREGRASMSSGYE